jgi:hypothetical protein
VISFFYHPANGLILGLRLLFVLLVDDKEVKHRNLYKDHQNEVGVEEVLSSVVPPRYKEDINHNGDQSEERDDEVDDRVFCVLILALLHLFKVF